MMPGTLPSRPASTSSGSSLSACISACSLAAPCPAGPSVPAVGSGSGMRRLAAASSEPRAPAGRDLSADAQAAGCASRPDPAGTLAAQWQLCSSIDGPAPESGVHTLPPAAALLTRRSSWPARASVVSARQPRSQLRCGSRAPREARRGAPRSRLASRSDGGIEDVGTIGRAGRGPASEEPPAPAGGALGSAGAALPMAANHVLRGVPLHGPPLRQCILAGARAVRRCRCWAARGASGRVGRRLPRFDPCPGRPRWA
jgi:hypothetical protein